MSYHERSAPSQGNSSARQTNKAPRSPRHLAMSSPTRPGATRAVDLGAGAGGGNNTTGSLKERKFSLLYRDVLECAG